MGEQTGPARPEAFLNAHEGCVLFPYLGAMRVCGRSKMEIAQAESATRTAMPIAGITKTSFPTIASGARLPNDRSKKQHGVIVSPSLRAPNVRSLLALTY